MRVCGPVKSWDYWIRAAALGFEIVSTGKQTYYYRKSQADLSLCARKDGGGQWENV